MFDFQTPTTVYDAITPPQALFHVFLFAMDSNMLNACMVICPSMHNTARQVRRGMAEGHDSACHTASCSSASPLKPVPFCFLPARISMIRILSRTHGSAVLWHPGRLGRPASRTYVLLPPRQPTTTTSPSLAHLYPPLPSAHRSIAHRSSRGSNRRQHYITCAAVNPSGMDTSLDTEASGTIATSPPQAVVIAIDGPAASGKGTLAKALALACGLAHLDTGLMYRAVGVKVGLFEREGGW